MTDDERALEEKLTVIRCAREIHCPYCDTLWIDEDRCCVSSSGDEPDVQVQCHNEHCEKFFMVKECVERTFETERMAQPIPFSSMSDGEFDGMLAGIYDR